MRGGKITALSEIPPAPKLINLINQVIALNEAGIRPTTPNPKLPDDFAAAIKQSDKATKHSGSRRKWQYVNWINKAKQQIRAKRIKTAVEWIGAGKAMK